MLYLRCVKVSKANVKSFHRTNTSKSHNKHGAHVAVCVCFMLSDSAIISCSVKDLHCRTSCKDVDCVDFCALKNNLCHDTQNCQWLSQEAETDGTHVYVEYSELGSIMLWSCDSWIFSLQLFSKPPNFYAEFDMFTNNISASFPILTCMCGIFWSSCWYKFMMLDGPIYNARPNESSKHGIIFTNSLHPPHFLYRYSGNISWTSLTNMYYNHVNVGADI